MHQVVKTLLQLIEALPLVAGEALLFLGFSKVVVLPFGFSEEIPLQVWNDTVPDDMKIKASTTQVLQVRVIQFRIGQSRDPIVCYCVFLQGLNMAKTPVDTLDSAVPCAGDIRANLKIHYIVESESPPILRDHVS